MTLFRRPAAFYPFLLMCGVCACGGRLLAQAPGQEPAVDQLIRMTKVDYSAVYTPQFEVGVRGMSTQRDGRKQWLMMTAEYKTAMEWTDEVTVTFYVVLEGQEKDLPRGSNTRNLFTGTVTYVNLPKGDHVSTMFLDPQTFARYGKVIASAALVDVDGRSAGVETKPSSTVKWWEGQSPNQIPLAKRSDTPWALVEIEKHDTIKP
jgi:hypothetical protein